MNKFFLILAIGLTVFVACKKETKTTPANNGSGVNTPATPFSITSFPKQIGYTCFYDVKTTYQTNDSLGNIIILSTYTSSCTETIIADTILPNGIVAQIWYVTDYLNNNDEYKKITYYDNALGAIIIKPFGGLYTKPYFTIKMPLTENTTWVNINPTSTDSCKSEAVHFQYYNNTNNQVISFSNYAPPYNDYVLSLGVKGLTEQSHVLLSQPLGLAYTLTEITLNHTNF